MGQNHSTGAPPSDNHNGTQESPAQSSFAIEIHQKDGAKPLVGTGQIEQFKKQCKRTCDVKVSVQHATILAHKCVLFQACGRVEEKLSSPFPWKDADVIKLPEEHAGCDIHQGMCNFLELIYEGKCMVEDMNTALYVLIVADDLKCSSDMKTAIVDAIVDNLDRDNCLMVHDVATNFQIGQLTEPSEKAIYRNFVNFTQREMNHLKYEVLLHVIQSPLLAIYSEESLCIKLDLWLRGGNRTEETNDDQKLEIVKCIHFGSLSNFFFRNNLLVHGAIDGNADLLKEIAIRAHSDSSEGCREGNRFRSFEKLKEWCDQCQNKWVMPLTYAISDAEELKKCCGGDESRLVSGATERIKWGPEHNELCAQLVRIKSVSVEFQGAFVARARRNGEPSGTHTSVLPFDAIVRPTQSDKLPEIRVGSNRKRSNCAIYLSDSDDSGNSFVDDADDISVHQI